MRFSAAFIALSVPFLVSAAPARIYGKRAAADILVFQFANVLEQLEAEFYTQALAKFQDADFVTAGFSSTAIPIEQFKKIQADEQAHSVFLEAALKSFNEEPIRSCKFNFDSALTDVATMAATARIVENVGVGAYMGGADLITDGVLLTAAASILTAEARHQTVLNMVSGTGSAIPSAFDIALTPSEVLALAAPFFDGPCDLGIPANPTLAVTNTGTVAPGTKLTFSSAAINGTVPEDQMFCQMLIGGNPTSISLPFSECVVPDGINGPVAIWVTSDSQPLVNNLRDRATSKLVAGPTYAFIDTQPETLGQVIRGGASGSTGAQESTSTRTISPDEASSILADATPTASVTDTATDSAATALATDPAVTDSASVTDSAATDSASASGSAPAAAGTAAAANDASASTGAPGGPNTFTGLSSDGTITVLGWSMSGQK